MTIELNKNSFFVFDLDDTIYKEIDFLKSAYRSISAMLMQYIGVDIYEEMWTDYAGKKNVFAAIIEKYKEVLPNTTVEDLLYEYRTHVPEISLANDVRHFLQQLKDTGVPLGLITDGRSITQRNKLKALGIIDSFQDLIISEEFGSEKPNPKNYLYFEDKYPDREFYFVGDNTRKDFVVPAQLGWHMICLEDSGQHIHRQDVTALPDGTHIITSFSEITLI